MFAYIKGIVQEKEAMNNVVHRLILDSHSFGLEIQISQHTSAMLPEAGAQAQVYTVFTIKETECLLFGFATQEEKDLFLLLTSVSGIGPKLALGLLGTLTPKQLAETIVQEDASLIAQAPGIGAKVAQRIILELKTKMENWQHENMLEINYQDNTGAKQGSIIDEEARTVLASLGYSLSEINHALSSIRKETPTNDIEGLVRESLKLLGAGNISPSNN
jgi:Holliday junction DNA helicase RuvA